MKMKIRVGLLFGGKSVEHEISLLSAKSILENLDREKFEPVLIGIDARGKWYLNDNSGHLLAIAGTDRENRKPEKALSDPRDNSLALVLDEQNDNLLNLEKNERLGRLDVVFPVLHGTYGEDGSVQGLLKLAGIPFVGCGVLGSSVCMDKLAMKRILTGAGIPTARYIACTYREKDLFRFSEAKETLGLPFIIKPAALGSSVGVHKVHGEAEFSSALEDAFCYDDKILIEEFVDGRELECAVIGNREAEASVPGEVIPDEKHEFYSYKAKYLDENGAVLKIPAEIDETTTLKVRELAMNTYKALFCEGMARVDFFLKRDNTVLVNEVNTIPGFTKISMFPKLWEYSGLSYTELISKLIALAMERSRDEKRIITDFKD